jgi:hypothetical protein
MLAFHYPPYFGSSGILRTLKFSKFLPENGWQCTVLTASPRAYPPSEVKQKQDATPPGVTVVRSFALDTAVHMSIAGRYPEWLALPDRWSSWWPSAMLAGLRIVRRVQPHVIWSTYPIATTHLIALGLHRLTGLPWVADFRDSMTEENYPTHPTRRRVYRWIERKAIENAARTVFTTRSTLRMYQQRYPATAADKLALIQNGFDEENFASAPAHSRAAGPVHDRPIRLLHTGVLYPHERDPTAFFAAVAQLRSRGAISSERLEIVLRASGHDRTIAPMIEAAGIGDIVKLAPPIPYDDAIREMVEVDGLLVFQAANSNHQIPAKVYEYMRAGRPILGITDPQGDTADVLRGASVHSLARLDDAQEIAAQLDAFVERIRAGTAAGADPVVTNRYSRRSQGADLARLLAQVVAGRPHN